MISYTMLIAVHTLKKHVSDVLCVAKQQKIAECALGKNSWYRMVASYPSMDKKYMQN